MTSISFSAELEEYYLKIKQNRWHWIFFILCRVLLAYAFLAAGIVKILGERFANGLSAIHPMGAYLEALHHTGYYYAFIGYAQVVAGVFLLIPSTVIIGALIYLPIIVNIWILSFAVRFEGSFVTSPLMVMANLYILAWNYDKLKYILPFNRYSREVSLPKPKKYETKFPILFFAGVVSVIGFTVWFASFGHPVMPRNSLGDCQSQFINAENEAEGFAFCECIHVAGNLLDQCLKNIETGEKIEKNVSSDLSK